MRIRFTSVEWTWLGLEDVALGTNFAQDFNLNVDMDSVDVENVATPIVKLSDAKRHASLLSSFLLENSLFFGANEIIGSQKFLGNLNKKTIANLGRQHLRTLDSHFKSS